MYQYLYHWYVRKNIIHHEQSEKTWCNEISIICKNTDDNTVRVST